MEIYLFQKFSTLFNLKNDPEEFEDLGQSKDYSKVRNEMKELLLKN